VTRFGAHKRGERVSGILHRALQQRGMGRKLPRRISPEVWESAVGPQIAARAQPTVLSKGVLHLVVQDHRWRDQLDAARVALMERINRTLGMGSVRALQFGFAHDAALADARRRAGVGVPQGSDVPVEPQRVLGGARLDGGLREAVLRAAEAAWRRRP